MKPFSTPSMVEPLEARIAPANIINVGNSLSTADTEYSDAPFVKTSLLADDISKAIGGDAKTFYLKLSAGDVLKLYSNTEGFQPYLTVTKGTVIAFFEDGAPGSGVANEVDANELMGLALGANASFTVKGAVGGDIVTNYNDVTQKLDYTTVGGVSKLVGPKQGISQIFVSGGVQGSILSGGSVSKLTVVGNVTNVLVGSATNNQAFDFLPGITGGNGTISYTPAAGEVGGSISNVQIQSLTLLQAGSGGTSAKGGSLSNIFVLQDNDGFTLQAGHGGDGAAGKIAGGLGGAVTNVFVSGSADTTPNSVLGSNILAGNGGIAASGGKGGAGGKLSKVYVGFDSVGNKPEVSSGISLDAVNVAAGRGGDGDTGGLGGSLSAVKVRVKTADVNGAKEITVRAGDGGKGVSASKGSAGAGGSIATVDVSNLDLVYGADLLLQAGNGGINMTPAVSKGAKGGAVTGANLVGFDIEVLAGNGSSGTVGGAGGALTKTHFLQFDTIKPNNVTASAGMGGNGTTGSGGAGGVINDFHIDNSDLTALTINGGTAANGGSSASGKGGNGGGVTLLDVTDTDTFGTLIEGTFALRAGKGGDGGTGGGKGGLLQKGIFTGEDLAVIVTSGSGGNASNGGAGGAGGLITNFNVTAAGTVGVVPVTATLTAGSGGNGAVKGAGGAGGDVKIANVKSDGAVSVSAGNGGNGVASTSAAGKGGSIVTVGAFADSGNGLLKAGDAGATGGKAAAGGSVQGASAAQVTALRASNDVSIIAGNGSNDGAGGNVTNVVFGSTSASLRPTPSGNVLVQAGAGFTLAKGAGTGGSIKGLSGTPSSGAGKSTQILAGDGGASAAKGGVGGSILNVAITGVGDDLVVANNTFVVVEAGNGGNAASAAKGAKGGDVKIVAFNNLDPDTKIRSIAAGDGGGAQTKGGIGGSLDNVRAVGGLDATTGAMLSADFGVRSGQVYGYATMGGLFAGLGGAGSAPGLAGNVTNISADSIAAIVAGKADAPQAVEKVEKITLNGLNHLKTIGSGDFRVTDVPDGGSHTTTLLPANATPDQVEAALRAAGVQANVIRTTSATYQITFDSPVDPKQLTASEFVPAEVVGVKNFSAIEIIPGTDVEGESQSFQPLATGTYSLSLYDLETAVLDASADNTQVQAAINALLAKPGVPLHQNVDPDTGDVTFVPYTVTVVGTPADGFTINFDQTDPQPVATIQAFPTPTQTIDILKAGQLVLTYNGGAQTAAINIPPENATALEIDQFRMAVDTALDSKVGGTGVNVTYDAVGSSLAVTFNTPASQEVLTGFNVLPLNAATTVPGAGTTKEIQTLSLVPRAVFSATDYAKANLVGAVVDPNEVGAPTFKFTKGAGNVGPGFQLGDKPIDGLVVAHVFNQAAVTFTPEARLIDGDFFDFDNKI